MLLLTSETTLAGEIRSIWAGSNIQPVLLAVGSNYGFVDYGLTQVTDAGGL